ncbi:TruD family tRNA pseudouridine synthase [Pseudoloma neurophilia]|uniref:TruD family tRNA pseudouridine synthase n=1 Tax=Pseudoloma neurophilia TaxID=146866 RepID=A0A0R0M5R6_9MICR|nr:TruD family tRNA pseudouridine synthase [Pseudoloma neurophilia]
MDEIEDYGIQHVKSDELPLSEVQIATKSSINEIYQKIGILSERPLVDGKIKMEPEDFVVEELFDEADKYGYDRPIDINLIKEYFTSEEISDIQKFDLKRDQKVLFKTINIDDKEKRKILHQELKKMPHVISESSDGKFEIYKSNEKGILSFVYKKKNKDTVECALDLAKELGINFDDIKFAGNKDRQAVTYQRFSVGNVYIDQLKEFSNVRRERDHLRLGKFYGNRFTILVRSVEGKNCSLDSVIEKITEKYQVQSDHNSINDMKDDVIKLDTVKIPNFFGIQRFGRHLDNHLIGEHIQNKKYQEAVDLIMKIKENDTEYVKEAKKSFHDKKFDEAYTLFPKNCITEKTIAKTIKKGTRSAIFSIKKTLRVFFLHAYQSYKFNLQLSRMLKNNEEKDHLNLTGSKVKRATFIKSESMSIQKLSEGYRISFILPPSAYATVVLRELFGDFAF